MQTIDIEEIKSAWELVRNASDSERNEAVDKLLRLVPAMIEYIAYTKQGLQPDLLDLQGELSYWERRVGILLEHLKD